MSYDPDECILCVVRAGKVEMKDFTLVLHGTEVEPGKPAPANGGNKFPAAVSTSNHVTHQDLTKDNTQRQIDSHDSLGKSSHPSPEIETGSGRSSAATKPTPILLSLVMTEASSVKKGGVEDTDHEGPMPVPVKMDPALLTPPPFDAGTVLEGCLNMDPNTSACLGLCLLLFALHYLLSVTFSSDDVQGPAQSRDASKKPYHTNECHENELNILSNHKPTGVLDSSPSIMCYGEGGDVAALSSPQLFPIVYRCISSRRLISSSVAVLSEESTFNFISVACDRSLSACDGEESSINSSITSTRGDIVNVSSFIPVRRSCTSARTSPVL